MALETFPSSEGTSGRRPIWIKMEAISKRIIVRASRNLKWFSVKQRSFRVLHSELNYLEFNKAPSSPHAPIPPQHIHTKQLKPWKIFSERHEQWHGGFVVSTDASQQDVSEYNSWACMGPFWVGGWMFSLYLCGFPPQSKDIRLIGDCKGHAH